MTTIGTIYVGLTNIEADITEPITEGLIGAYIKVEFENSAWASLIRRVGFKAGSVSISVPVENGYAVLPWEITQSKGKMVFAGITGTTQEGVLIPTVWVSLGNVQQGTTPGIPEGADPTLPVWAQVEARVIGLEQEWSSEKKNLEDAADNANEAAEGVNEAVTSANQAAVSAKNAAALAIQEANNATSIANTVQQKLDSGEFKGDTGPQGTAGYTPVKGTDYFTEADKTELVNLVLANFTDVSEVAL